MSSGMSWCRLWSDLPNDPKWRSIARVSKRSISEVIAVYIHMLVNASNNASERGTLERWSDEAVADALDLDPEAVQAIRTAMQGRVLDGNLLTGWARRQPKREDAGSTQRSQEHRKKKRDATQGDAVRRDATQGDAAGRDATQGDAPEKSREDTDKDNPMEREVGDSPRARPKPNGGAPPSRGRCGDFPDCPDWLKAESWQAYLDHRTARAKPLTVAAATITLQDLARARAFGHDPDAMLRESIVNGWLRCVFPDRHFQPPPAAPKGRRKGQTIIEHMIESHARMDALLDEAERAESLRISETVEEASYVRH